MFRSSRPEVFLKKLPWKIVLKVKEKHLQQSPIFGIIPSLGQ